MKRLPIGFVALEEIINDGCVYVDKTKFIYNLVNTGKYYFLSRPRRFGKSVFVDTLKQAFLGNKALFKGLNLEDNWDWETKYPVIHISFGSNQPYIEQASGLIDKITAILERNADEHGLTMRGNSYSENFQNLIIDLFKKYQQKVVVLVDEYDKPILDVIEDSALAKISRDVLRGLYSVIKDLDHYLKFVFLTGISKFSKVSLFSGLNSLNDITLDARYADICGYTQNELEQNFSEYINDGNIDLTKLKKWYNGYSFIGDDTQKVYNPFDILLFFDSKYIYDSYWFETSTPTFLVKVIEKNRYFMPEIESITITKKELGAFDIEKMSLYALLFQTGYLTIKEVTTIGTQRAYVLSYPNLEVKAALNDSLAEIGSTPVNKSDKLFRLAQILDNNELDQLGQLFASHFASIPNNWYVNNDMEHYEGFYASIVYSFLCALGYDLIAEDVTNRGRIDLTLKMPDKIIILEFKLNKYGNAKDALTQIKNKGYSDKYKKDNLPIYLIGISFNPQTCNLEDYMLECTP